MKSFYTKLEIIAIIDIAENLHEFEPVLCKKKNSKFKQLKTFYENSNS
jgi:hypothetical protein